MAPHRWKVVWNYAETIYGVLYVTAIGPPSMPEWSVDNWDTLLLVCAALNYVEP